MKNSPVFYPSVSSVAKNKLTTLEHIEILYALRYPNFLISAYDIFNLNKDDKKRFNKIHQQLIQNNTDIIVDSGMYEKVWARDDKWCFEKYKLTIDTLKYNFVFNFDDYIDPQNTPIKDILKSIKKTNVVNLAPILHSDNISNLPNLCLEIASIDEVNIIAIPERELGNGIIEGLETILKIKLELNKLDKCIKIHILGAGNPLSLLVYSALGVDSFDGLDWCQTVADYENATLHHSLQLDFYAHQSKLGNDKSIPYNLRLFSHNLEFYQQWMRRINEEIASNSIKDMLKYYLPKSIIKDVLHIYGEYDER